MVYRLQETKYTCFNDRKLKPSTENHHHHHLKVVVLRKQKIFRIDLWFIRFIYIHPDDITHPPPRPPREETLGILR